MCPQGSPQTASPDCRCFGSNRPKPGAPGCPPPPGWVLAQGRDEPCFSSPGVVLCGFYGVHSDKIYRRLGGFRVVVRQKHAKTRSKCHFEAIWGPIGQMERRRTSFVYYAWASTTCIEAFVLLVAAVAPFTSFAAGAARPRADYQRWNS